MRKTVRRRSKSKGTRRRHRSWRKPWPSVFEQRHYDIAGLGLVACAVFFSLVFYLSWDGGRVGDSLAWVLTYIFGLVAYLVPLALLAAGALLIIRPYIPSLSPFKIGSICLFLALTLGLSAQALGVGSSEPVRDSVLYAPYLTTHGGIVGELLYRGTSALFQHAGAVLISLFLAATGILLLSGASISGVLGRSRHAVSQVAQRAGLGSQEFVAKLEARLKQTDTYETQAYPQSEMGHSHGTVAVGPEDEDQTVASGSSQADLSASGQDHAPVLAGTEVSDNRQTQIEIEHGTCELTPQGNRRSTVTESGDVTYRLPGTDFLKKSGANAVPDTSNQKEVSARLVEVLKSFNVDSRIVGAVNGPHVTRYELQLAAGTKVAKVAQLKDDLAYALASTEIRILTPIPGKQAVGVEVPNRSRRIVHLGDIMSASKKGVKGRGLPKDASPAAVWLGKDVAGKAVWTDLAQMPHILVAGTTGSGKSGCINAMLSSVLLRSTPDQVRTVLIDPKQVELNYYDSIPHLLAPLVTSPRLAANVLGNLVKEMESRYDLMSDARCRNLLEFNRFRKSTGDRTLPYILCIVDELADLMMVASTEVEESIIRLAQKSRAVGIHLVLATQRPSTDIITGTIKVNIPARIAFAVSSQIDSRVILDQVGAESLLGQGDMLFRPAGSSKLQRIQGAYITEDEIAELTSFWASQEHPEMQEDLLDTAHISDDADGNDLSPDRDELLEKAISLVVMTQTASVSMLQRRLRVGYTRAGRLIDMLERRGIISGYEGSKPRQVLVQEHDLGRILSDQWDKREEGQDMSTQERDLVTTEHRGS